jgi:8-oxo-dGTP pyrophosphatase MutT (NUDIX family)
MDLERLQAEAEANGFSCVVGALIVNNRGWVFVQKRSPDRRLFPGCWDIAGGHVEPDETLFEALAREIEEETGWQLVEIKAVVEIIDWEEEIDGRATKNREFDFLVEVSGDLDHPQIEQEKFTEFRWVGEEGLEILQENRTPDDDLIFSLARKALAL